MSLVKAESRRLFKRRMTRWSLVIGVLILAAIATGIFLSHSKPTPEALAAAQVEAERVYQEQLGYFEEFKAECERHSGGEKCLPPPRDAFPAEQFLPPQFVFKEAFGNLVMAWAAIIAMIGFLIGATFVGAEWSSGSMMNLLTWKPKRMTVLGTKLGVLLGGMAAVGVTTFGLWSAALWTTGHFRGNTDGMTPGTWQSFGLSGLRGIAMILAFAALGFLIASIGRHTALAMGLAIGVLIVGQIGLRIVLELARVKFPDQYLIPVHMSAWLDKKVTLYDWSGTVECTETGCSAPELVITYQQSGLIGLSVAVVVAAIAFWSMRRRDIA